MSRRFVVILQALILLVVGAVMVYFYAAGRIGTYLTSAGSFQIQAVLAGVVLGVIGLFLILTSGAEDVCTHDHGDEGHDHDHDHSKCDHDHGKCDHEHSHGEHVHDHDHDHDGGHHHHEDTVGGVVVTALVILVPLVSAALLTPDAYSAGWNERNGLYSGKGVVGKTPEAFDLKKQAGRGEAGEPGAGGKKDVADDAGWGPYTIEDFKQQVDQNADGEFLMDVVSIFYTGGDEEVRNVVNGLKVETMGQVMPEKIRNPDGTRVRVFRLMMNCCIADARPVSIPVDFGGSPPQYKEMGWYKIHGTMSYEQWDEFSIPVLRAHKMEPTEEPPQTAFGQRN